MKIPTGPLKFAATLGSSLLAGFIGAAFPTGQWYEALNKPPFTPPEWLFAPVWTTLYILMGIAAFLVWRQGLNKGRVRIAMALFTVQLALNALWSPIFFGLHLIGAALAEIIMLWAAVIATAACFRIISRQAAVLMYPYVLWVGFAVLLNAAFWVLNP